MRRLLPALTRIVALVASAGDGWQVTAADVVHGDGVEARAAELAGAFAFPRTAVEAAVADAARAT